MYVKRDRYGNEDGFVVFVPDSEVPKFASMWWQLWRLFTFGLKRPVETIHPPE